MIGGERTIGGFYLADPFANVMPRILRLRDFFVGYLHTVLWELES
jgi:hypothetical protein